MTNSQKNIKASVLGLILAGGQSKRMGTIDKATLCVKSKRLIDHAMKALTHQLSTVAISGRTSYGYEVPFIQDRRQQQGPVAGVKAALDWVTKHDPVLQGILTVPVDAPLISLDLVSKLCTDLQKPAIAKSNSQVHPTFAYWPIRILPQINQLFTDCQKHSKSPSLLQVADLTNADRIEFDTAEAFININSPSDLAHYEALYD